MRPALFDAARAEIYFRNSILILFTVTMAKTVVRKNLSQMQQKRALFSHFDGNECK
jgi:altronate dehydratase